MSEPLFAYFQQTKSTTMNNLLKLAFACFFAFSWSLPAQNAFSFDGSDDYGATSNGSALIANASGFSMSMWVYPETLVSGYPNFGGMAGFRNESNCDFYILQLNSNNVEARLRNSSGSVYTITYNSGMNMNAWNHFVLVYNGSMLKLYHDGSQVSSITASGSISSTNTPFNIGYLPFSGANFHFDGSIDDLELWDKALSASEVTGLFGACGYNLSSSNLKAVYNFNQGTAGGNNTSISTFTDSKGSAHATISGAARSGNSSNFVNGLSGSFSDSLTIDACKNYTSPLGTVYTSSGIYTDSITGSSGCDSVYYIDLTIYNVDSTASVNGGTISANDTSSTATYQWLDCNTGQVIIGVTNRSFSPTLSGNYAVIVTNGNCTDTSACYTVNVSGVGLQEWASGLDLYPNPSSGIVTLKAPLGSTIQSYQILDISAKILQEGNLNEKDQRLDLCTFKDGVYFFKVYFEGGAILTERLVLNRS